MDWKKKLRILVKTVVVTTILTLILLLLLTLLLYKFNFNEKYIGGGIIFIYLAANFIGGLLIGKICENRRFVWGGLSGLFFVAVLLVISMIANGLTGLNGREIAVALLTCTISGSIGGMMS